MSDITQLGRYKVNGVLGQVMLVTPQIRAASGVLRAPVVEPD